MVADDAPGSSDLLAEFGIVAAPESAPAGPLQGSGHQLLRRLISRRFWKHLTLLAALTLAVGFLLLACLNQVPFVPASAAIRLPRVVDTVAGLELLVAGQLAILIGWIRGRSQVDFRGRYRAWKWLGALLIAGAVMTLADLQAGIPIVLSTLLEPLLGSISAARPALFVIPVLGASCLILARVLPDLGRHRTAQSLLLAAALPGLIGPVALPQVAAGRSDIPGDVPLLLIGAHLTLAALLLHTRFVAWVCNDPPERRRAAAPKSSTTTPTQPAPPAHDPSHSNEPPNVTQSGPSAVPASSAAPIAPVASDAPATPVAAGARDSERPPVAEEPPEQPRTQPQVIPASPERDTASTTSPDAAAESPDSAPMRDSSAKAARKQKRGRNKRRLKKAG